MTISTNPLDLSDSPLDLPATDVVQIWTVRLDHNWPTDALSIDEQQRAERYALELPRRNFRVMRAALRAVLGRYLRLLPSAVRIEIEPAGKPFVRGGPYFSLSHSGDRGLIAVASAGVGVDIERVRALPNAAALVNRFFSTEEREQFAALPDSLRDVSFFRGWTAKEALLKAAGIGLAGLDRCAVDLDPRRSPRIVRFDGPGEWSIFTCKLDAGYIASVVLSCGTSKEH